MEIHEIYEEYENGIFSTLKNFVKTCSKKRLVEFLAFAIVTKKHTGMLTIVLQILNK